MINIEVINTQNTYEKHILRKMRVIPKITFTSVPPILTLAKFRLNEMYSLTKNTSGQKFEPRGLLFYKMFNLFQNKSYELIHFGNYLSHFFYLASKFDFLANLFRPELTTMESTIPNKNYLQLGDYYRFK